MLQLEYRGSTTLPLEAECITPDQLAGKSVAEIAALPVQYGNAPAPLGDFFTITGEAGDRHIVVQGDCSRVKLLGSRMTSGKLTIHGAAGMHLGAEMTGGELELYGQAGDWVGGEMRGGRLHVHGDVGNNAGAAYRGSRVGMRGGVLLIDGSAGDELGSAMRRGLIAVGGESGAFAGVSMVAGSLFLFGPTGGRVGANMKRGTIALFGPPPALLPSFRHACEYRPVFLRLYLKQLQTWGFPVPADCLDARYHRYCGDLASLGLGELFLKA